MPLLDLTEEEATALKICLFNQGSSLQQMMDRLNKESQYQSLNYVEQQFKLLESIWYKLKEED